MQTFEAAEVGTSPFAGAVLTAREDEVVHGVDTSSWGEEVASPFAPGFTTADEVETEQTQWAALVDELSDESFDEAVESLVEEVAGRHLSRRRHGRPTGGGGRASQRCPSGSRGRDVGGRDAGAAGAAGTPTGPRRR